MNPITQKQFTSIYYDLIKYADKQFKRNVDSVDIVNESAFDNNALTEVRFLGNRPRIRDGAFGYNEDLSIINVCSGTVGWPGRPIYVWVSPLISPEISVISCDTDGDGDGVSDTQEQIDGTNPLVADTDGDGLTDGQEVTVSINLRGNEYNGNYYVNLVGWKIDKGTVAEPVSEGSNEDVDDTLPF